MYDRSPPVDHCSFHRHWAGRSGVYDGLQRGHVGALTDFNRKFQHANEMGWYEGGMGNVVLFDQCERPLRVELLHEYHSPTEALDRHCPPKRRGMIKRRS